MWNDAADDLVKETDVAFEEELSRNPYSIKIWDSYLDAKKGIAPSLRYLLFERAIQAIPGCYKIWQKYLKERRQAVKHLCVTHVAYEACNSVHERCLVYCGKMPRVWLDFLEFLMKQKQITKTRRTLDAALKSLPITQHHRIWDLAIQWLAKNTKSDGKGAMIPEETATCLFRRYLQLQPGHVETYIAYLLSVRRYDEASERLAEVVNDDNFISIEGKTIHQLWMDLCDIIARHPKHIRSLPIEPVIRSGLMKFTDEVGRLWTALADHFVRLGMFEKARDIYEEGIEKVSTVHDFSIIWEAYTKFMESWLTALVEKNSPNADMLLARNEALADRRPELLSSVLLRQNPHNVHQWIERTHLYNEKPQKVVDTFTESVLTVDPQKAVGKVNVLWSKFAGFYEKYGDLDNARVIYEKATHVNFKHVDDLASIWCEWIEFELRHQEFDKALAVARQSVTFKKDTQTVQSRLYRSIKLWSLVSDLEESFGTHETVMATYDRMFQMKVITPQIVINYAHYLESRHWYEESFKTYERGVKIFKRPHSNDIWLFYLTKFVERYGGRKLERARDLFEEALVGTKSLVGQNVYCLYAQLEEKHGLARHALAIYDRLTKVAEKEYMYGVFCVLIAKTQEFFGATKSRDIYERAIEAMPEGWGLRKMCMKYARLEAALGEVDRARAIFLHASQFCDPRTEHAFWAQWRYFEVQHGNEDTFRDMLRVKRSVDAQYAQVHFNAENVARQKVERKPADPMAQAELIINERVETEKEDEAQARMRILQKLGTTPREERANFQKAESFQGPRVGYIFKHGIQGVGYYEDLRAQKSAVASSGSKRPREAEENPEEIDIGLDMDVDMEELEEAPVPRAVFGESLAQAAGQGDATEEKES